MVTRDAILAGTSWRAAAQQGSARIRHSMSSAATARRAQRASAQGGGVEGVGGSGSSGGGGGTTAPWAWKVAAAGTAAVCSRLSMEHIGHGQSTGAYGMGVACGTWRGVVWRGVGVDVPPTPPVAPVEPPPPPSANTPVAHTSDTQHAHIRTHARMSPHAPHMHASVYPIMIDCWWFGVAMVWAMV